MKSLNSSDLLSDKEARNELYDLLHQSLSRKQAIERVVEIGTGYLDLDTVTSPVSTKPKIGGKSSDQRTHPKARIPMASLRS